MINKINIDHDAYPKSLRTKSDAALFYIREDARAALGAMPDGPKAGYYADEINYVSMELFRRTQKRKTLHPNDQQYGSVYGGDDRHED